MRSRLALRLAGMTIAKRAAPGSPVGQIVALILPVAAGEAGLIAGHDFRCVERIRKPGFGGAGFQRLLLKRIRGPVQRSTSYPRIFTKR